MLFYIWWYQYVQCEQNSWANCGYLGKHNCNQAGKILGWVKQVDSTETTVHMYPVKYILDLQKIFFLSLQPYQLVKKCNLTMQKTFNLQNQMKPCWLVTDEHCIYKWLEINSNSLLLQVLLKTFKIINFRKNSRQMSWETIKTNRSHLWEKCASSRQNSTQIAVFWPLFELVFFWAKLKPFIFTDFDSIPVFDPDIFMPQKFSDKYVKSANSLKYTLTNCVFYFLICIMVLIYEGYSIKKRHTWIQYLLTLNLLNWFFSRFLHTHLSWFVDKTTSQLYCPSLHFIEFFYLK